MKLLNFNGAVVKAEAVIRISEIVNVTDTVRPKPRFEFTVDFGGGNTMVVATEYNKGDGDGEDGNNPGDKAEVLETMTAIRDDFIQQWREA